MSKQILMVDIEKANEKNLPMKLSYTIVEQQDHATKELIHKVFHTFPKYRKGKMLKKTQKDMKEFFESEDIKKFLKS